MATLNRKEFLRSVTGMAAIASFPEVLFGGPARRTVRAQINDLGIVDLHCHPSLKMYLLGKRIWKNHGLQPSEGPNDLAMQITLSELSSGWIRGMLCAHHVPEKALTREATRLKKLYPIIKALDPRLAEKIEYEDASNFTQINIMIDTLEAQLHRANQEQSDVRLVVARNYSEFEDAIESGHIPVAHAIEGAHALGRNRPLKSIDCKHPPDDFPQKGSMRGDVANYLRNLDALKARGVCLMTLSHFFENDVSFPVEGISPDEKKRIGLHWAFDPSKCDRPLTSIGEAVVRRMLDIGMIVDLTHATPSVRREVFKINNEERKCAGLPVRPLTFTHTGYRKIFESGTAGCNGGSYKNYGYYAVDEGDIDQICACNGVIGVIPENFWLVGCDPKLGSQSGDQFRDGIRFIVDTIVEINNRTWTKDYDNIGIGTDFDGLADAPRDLYIPSQLGALIRALGNHPAIKPEHINKITSCNAMRMLKEGWT